MRLQDKVAVITGAANGIGKETALLFAANGAHVIVADYDEHSGVQTAQEILKLGGKAKFHLLNVGNREQIEEMIQSVKEQFGRIDVLVNNAGITRDGMLTKLQPEQWDQVLAINLSGVFHCSQLVAQVMVEQGNGVILNAASVVGLYGNIGQSNYAATKAGVIGMTKTMAKELGPKGIRVNAVAPGFIMTGMTEKVPDKILESMQSKTPLRRLGVPRDIANAYLFLASEDASYINGAVLSVDGGLTL